MTRAPARFVLHDRPGFRLYVDAEFESEAGTIGFADPETARTIILDLKPTSTGSTGRARTRVLARSEHAGAVHLKRALKGGWLAPMFAGRVPFWRRARREVEAGRRLHAAGAPVPRPLLAVAVRAGAGWWAAVGGEYIHDARNAGEVLSEAENDEVRLLTLARMGRVVRHFHDRGGRHADLNVTNIVLAPDPSDPGSTREWIVDLQGARFGPVPAASRRSRELQRLRRSLIRRDLLAGSDEHMWERLRLAYEGER